VTERDESDSNIIIISNILESYRKNFSLYLSENIIRNFRAYARRHLTKSTAECLEEALMEYMDNHPVDGVTLSFEANGVTKQVTIAERLSSRILSNKIENTLIILDRLDGDNRRIAFRDDLQNHILKAFKLRTRSDRLTGLIERAEEYL